jgi:hypothetical protein
LKQPNLLRQETPGATAFVVSDGRRIYQVSNSGRTEINQPSMAPLLHVTIDNGLLEDTKQGIRYEYVGSAEACQPRDRCDLVCDLRRTKR